MKGQDQGVFTLALAFRWCHQKMGLNVGEAEDIAGAAREGSEGKIAHLAWGWRMVQAPPPFGRCMGLKGWR